MGNVEIEYVARHRDHAIIFFFNDTATTEIYTLSLHDALPISGRARRHDRPRGRAAGRARSPPAAGPARHPGAPRYTDRKSTRLNSSHANISYAVFCLKKKKKRKRVKSSLPPISISSFILRTHN